MNAERYRDSCRVLTGFLSLGMLAIAVTAAAVGAEPEIVEVFAAGREVVRGDQGRDYETIKLARFPLSWLLNDI